MNPKNFRSTAVFADDVRLEASGQVSLVGILPDNISFDPPEDEEEGVQAILPKLGVYIRTSFPTSMKTFSDLRLHFRSPSGEEIHTIPVAKELVKAETKKAKLQGAPFMTLVSRIVMAPFPVLEAGRFTIEAEFAGEKMVAGFLQIAPSSLRDQQAKS